MSLSHHIINLFFTHQTKNLLVFLLFNNLLNMLNCIVMMMTTYFYLIFFLSQLSFAMSLAFFLSFYFNFVSLTSFSFMTYFSLIFLVLILTFLTLILAFSTSSLMMHYFNKLSSDCMFNNIFM